MTRLRSGCNELRINTGRWESLPVAERICPQCCDAVEDERHFLLHCTFLKDEHKKLWHSINAACSQSHEHALPSAQPVVVDAFGWSEEERFTLLTGEMHPDVQAARMERKVRTLILAALSDWMEKRRKELDWMESCLLK